MDGIVARLVVGMTILDDLRTTGVAMLGTVPWIDAFNAHLDACEQFPGHVHDRPRDGITHNASLDVTLAPGLYDYARRLTPIASKYFKGPAYLWSFNRYTITPETPDYPSIVGWHRDREADKILVLFMYCSDVETEADGPFQIEFEQKRRPILGPKGTAFLADTTNLHRATLPTKGPRVNAWARWKNSK